MRYSQFLINTLLLLTHLFLVLLELLKQHQNCRTIPCIPTATLLAAREMGKVKERVRLLDVVHSNRGTRNLQKILDCNTKIHGTTNKKPGNVLFHRTKYQLACQYVFFLHLKVRSVP